MTVGLPGSIIKPSMLKKVLWAAGALIVVAAGFVVMQIGPRNVIGKLRYDTRREGELRVGDRAPDVQLLALDGKTRQSMLSGDPTRPTVLIFGSFT